MIAVRFSKRPACLGPKELGSGGEFVIWWAMVMVGQGWCAGVLAWLEVWWMSGVDPWVKLRFV